MADAPLPKAVLDFDQFLNEPPEYESQRMVRDYRHDVYPRWVKALDAMKAQIAALASTPPAEPKVKLSDERIRSGWVKRLNSAEVLQGETPRAAFFAGARWAESELSGKGGA